MASFSALLGCYEALCLRRYLKSQPPLGFVFYCVGFYSQPFFSRRLVRVQGRESGPQAALGFGRGRTCPSVTHFPGHAARDVLPCGYPAQARTSPSVLRCHRIKNPFLEAQRLWSCSSFASRGRAAFPSSKGSWVSLRDGAEVQRLRGAARIRWEKLGSVLSALEIEMEISKDQTSFGNFQSYVVFARPENPS